MAFSIAEVLLRIRGESDTGGAIAETTAELGALEGQADRTSSQLDRFGPSSQAAARAAAEFGTSAGGAGAGVRGLGTEAETTVGKTDNLGASLSRIGQWFREAQADAERTVQPLRDLGLGSDELAGALRRATSTGFEQRLSGEMRPALEATGMSSRDAGSMVRNLASDLIRSGEASRQATPQHEANVGVMGRLRSAGSEAKGAIDFLGTSLRLLGTGGKETETGLKGAVSAADGATTGFSTFTSAARMASQVVSLVSAANIGLVGILIVLGVAFSPVIAAVGAFTVALAGAMTVMLIGVGALGALGAGMVLLAAKTGQLNGPLETLKNTWQGVADTLGKQAVPAAREILGWLNQFAAPVQKMGSELISWFGDRLPQTLHLFSSLIGQTFGFLQQIGTAVGGVIDHVLSHSGQFQSLFGMILQVGAGAVTGLLTNLVKLSDWFFSTLPTFQPLISAVFGGLGSILMGTIQFIGRFGLAFADLFNGIKGHQSVVSDLIHAFTSLGVPWNTAIDLATDLGHALTALKSVIGGAVDIVKTFGAEFAKTFAKGEATSGFGQALEQVGQSLGRLMQTLKPVADDLGRLAGTVLSQNFMGAVMAVVPHVLDFANAVGQKVVPVVHELTNFLITMYPVIQKIGIAFAAYRIATIAASAATAIFNAVMDANPITLIIIAIALLAFGIYELITHWKEITDWVGRLWNAFTHTAPIQALIQMFDRVRDAITTLIGHFQNLPTPIKIAFGIIAAIILGPLTPIIALIAGIVLLATHWQQVTDTIRRVVSQAAQFVVQNFNDLRQRVTGAVQAVLDWIRQHWDLILFLVMPLIGVIALIITHWEQIKQTFQRGIDFVKQIVQAGMQWIHDNIYERLVNIVQTVQSTLNDWHNRWDAFWNQLKSLGAAALQWIYDNTIGRLVQLIQWVASWIQQHEAQWNAWLEREKALVLSMLQWVWDNTIGRLQQLIAWVIGWIQQHEAEWNAWLEREKSLIGAMLQWVWDNTIGKLLQLLAWVIGWIQQHEAQWNQWLETIKSWLGAALQWIWDNTIGKLLQLIQWVQGWIGQFENNWNQWLENIKQLAGAAIQWVHDTWNDWTGRIEQMVGSWRDRVVGVFNDMKGKIGQLASEIAGFLKDNFKKGVQDILTVLSHFFEALKNLPGLGSVAGGWDSTVQSAYGDVGKLEEGGLVESDPVRMRQHGGVVTSPMYLIGEGAGPETVIPHEPRYRDRAMALWQNAGRAIGAVAEGGQIVGNCASGMCKAAGGVIGLQGGGVLGAIGGAIGNLAGSVGGIGGECVVFLENITGQHWPVAYAAQMCPMVNSRDAKPGEIAVFAGGQYGHVAMVTGGDNSNFSVIDSNWVAPETIGVHNMNTGMYNWCGFIDLGIALGSLGSLAAAGLGNLAETVLNAMHPLEDTAKGEMNNLGGWPGSMGSAILTNIIQGAEDWVHQNLKGSTTGGNGPSAGTHGNVTPDQLHQYMQQVGFNPAGGTAWADKIVTRESGFNSDAIGPAVNGDGGSIGLWQIQPAAWPQFDKAKLHDPLYNTWAAMQVYQQQGPNAWSTNYAAGGIIGGLIQLLTGGLLGPMAGLPGAPRNVGGDAEILAHFHNPAQAPGARTPTLSAAGGLIPRTFDTGGTLFPGINIVNNATGVNEPVVPANGLNSDDLVTELVNLQARTNQLLERIASGKPVNGLAASMRFA